MTPLPVSVVVVSRGRPEALKRCLLGLSQLQYDPFELIVVADPAGMATARAMPFAAHLKLHGAAITTHLLTTAVSDGEEILRFAREQQADLIVMGAYGHSRLREWAFGGATRDILQASSLCCLMAH